MISYDYHRIISDYHEWLSKDSKSVSMVTMSESVQNESARIKPKTKRVSLLKKPNKIQENNSNDTNNETEVSHEINDEKATSKNSNKVLDKLLSMNVSELTSGQLRLLNMFLIPRKSRNDSDKCELPTVTPIDEFKKNTEYMRNNDSDDTLSSSSQDLSSSSETESQDENTEKPDVTPLRKAPGHISIARIQNIPPRPKKERKTENKYSVHQVLLHDHYYTDKKEFVQEKYDKVRQQLQIVRKKLKVSQTRTKRLERQILRLQSTIDEQAKLLRQL